MVQLIGGQIAAGPKVGRTLVFISMSTDRWWSTFGYIVTAASTESPAFTFNVCGWAHPPPQENHENHESHESHEGQQHSSAAGATMSLEPPA